MKCTCPVCGDSITRGDRVVWMNDGDVPGESSDYRIHEECDVAFNDFGAHLEERQYMLTPGY